MKLDGLKWTVQGKKLDGLKGKNWMNSWDQNSKLGYPYQKDYQQIGVIVTYKGCNIFWSWLCVFESLCMSFVFFRNFAIETLLIVFLEATSMLMTDVWVEMYWRQLWDVGDGFGKNCHQDKFTNIHFSTTSMLPFLDYL